MDGAIQDSRDAASVRFRMLGGWDACDSRGRTTPGPTGINGEVAAAVLLSPEKSWSRRELAIEIWGAEEREVSVAQRLRTALYSLRKWFDSAQAGASTVL